MEGKVKVVLTLREPPLSRTHYVVFLVVKLPLNYNAILRKPIPYYFEAITSIRFLTMKFPTESGVVQERQEEVQAVYLATVEEPNAQLEKINPEVMEIRDEKKKAKT